MVTSLLNMKFRLLIEAKYAKLSKCIKNTAELRLELMCYLSPCHSQLYSTVRTYVSGTVSLVSCSHWDGICAV